MSNYGYEEPLTAETLPAGEIDSGEPTEPAAFNVSITEANDSVEAGDPLEVDAAIENTGGENGTQDVQLAIDGSVVNETPVSLEPGASESVTLTADTADLEPGEYPVTVSTDNATAETTVTIEEPGEAEFAVADLEAPASGEPGSSVTVDATIENVGDAEGTQTVSYAVDGQTVAEESVALEAGGATTLSFSLTLPETDSTHTVATDDEQASVTIAATQPAEEEPSETGPTETEPTDEGPPEPTEPPAPESPGEPEGPAGTETGPATNGSDVAAE